MAYKRCTLKPDAGCIGCGLCEEKPVYEDVFGDPIYEGDIYYDIDGEFVTEGNLAQWAKRYKREAIKYVV